MKKVAMLLTTLVVLAGCNTMDGLSKDLKKGGDQIHKAITK
ncbi:MAG: entericidin [Gallionella sp.]|nr:entericidin [Gallionella sp.]